MPLTQRFSIALRHYRQLGRLSQDELAFRAGLDRTYISQLERGAKSPTLTTIEALSLALGVDPALLLKEVRLQVGPRTPTDYALGPRDQIDVQCAGRTVHLPAAVLTSAINTTHELIDELYSVSLDIAAVLGMRNLSAFIGELVSAAIIKNADGVFRANPHQDGYPNLLLMDKPGMEEWERLAIRTGDKAPFSPFRCGGIEVKATCGSVPSPAVFRKRGKSRPALGATRAPHLSGYDWKAHHRDTNNLVGVVWDFVDGRPRVAAMFYSSALTRDDWGRIVTPRDGGGRTTSVSIIGRSGIRKMYAGWVCVLKTGGYAEFFNKRNEAQLIPTG